MNTAILYVSKYGSTEKVARLIAQKLDDKQTELINLKIKKDPDLEPYDLIILGCGIYAGKASKSFQDFCKKNLNTILSKKTGLFICGMEVNPEKQQQQILSAYPVQLLQHADAKAFLGGEFLFEKMNFMERTIIKRIAKTDESVSAIKEKDIASFVEVLNR